MSDWMLFKMSDLQNMDLDELKDHENKLFAYWTKVRKVVEYRELIG